MFSNQSMFGLSVGLRLAIAAVVIAAVAIPLITVGNTIHSVDVSVPPGIVTSGVTTKSQTPPVHKPSEPISYLTTRGVQAGLARLAKLVPGARLDQVRLDNKSLIASARLPHGGFKEVVFEPTGTFVTTGASTGERLFSPSQISPRAVERIVSGMRRRFHVPAAKIDYMVTSPTFAGGTQWVVFAKTPGHPGFTATLSGERLSRLPG
jgi:hypothetical protein